MVPNSIILVSCELLYMYNFLKSPTVHVTTKSAWITSDAVEKFLGFTLEKLCVQFLLSMQVIPL